MLSWLRSRAPRHAREPREGDLQDPGVARDPEILDCLQDVLDPEVGVSVVHLGLVYRAVRTPGRIDVDLTLTTRTCPLGSLLVDDALGCLKHRFNDCPTICVKLVWSPAWTHDRITDLGLELLGHPPRILP